MSGGSIFAAYTDQVEALPERIVVRLSNGFNFVFRATRELSEIQEIEKEAAKHGRDRLKGTKRTAWELYKRPDESDEKFAMSIMSAHHFAARHVGFLTGEDGEEKLVEEAWSIEQFLWQKAKDGYAFKALMDGLNEVVGVAYNAVELSEKVDEKKGS